MENNQDSSAGTGWTPALIGSHIDALPILIAAVRRLPDGQEVLAAWDKARALGLAR